MMPPNSTSRRHKTADRKYRFSFETMRPCAQCAARQVPCQVVVGEDKCSSCFRGNLSCEWSVSLGAMDRVIRELERLEEREVKAEEEVVAARRKLIRFRKQRRLLREQLRSLGQKEEGVLAEFEAEERQQAELEAVLGSPSTGPAASALDEFFERTVMVTSGTSEGSR